jgi:hypothetical protein
LQQQLDCQRTELAALDDGLDDVGCQIGKPQKPADVRVAEGQVPFARPLMFFIIFGGPLPQFATAIWTASLYNRALSATQVKQLYNAGR